LPAHELRPAVFLDRDGLLNELVFYVDTQEWESPRTPEDLRLVPGAAAFVTELARRGWAIVLISNQPSFAKGKTTLDALKAVHGRFLESLGAGAAGLTDAYYCYHHPQGIVEGYSSACPCRKPSPFLLRQAGRDHSLDLDRSWMVGDQDTDVLSGRNAGCRTILVPCEASASKRGAQPPDFVCQTLGEVTEVIGPPQLAREAS
jgi:D-glycero-D-manno-heptose 1,7-bisphosphate phosphatase